MPRKIAALALALLLAACGGQDKAAADPKALEAAKAYLQKNATEPGVKTLPSGLQYKVVREGPAGGLRPKEADEVKVHYEGKLVSGEVFDSSYERGAPASMPLAMLIPGWIEALQLMRPGDEWTLYVPPELGYGADAKPGIPANSVLIFRIELIDVLPAPGSVQKG